MKKPTMEDAARAHAAAWLKFQTSPEYRVEMASDKVRRASRRSCGRPPPGVHPSQVLARVREHEQRRVAAVDAAIASSNRAGRKIGKREAAAIHALLRGR